MTAFIANTVSLRRVVGRKTKTATTTRTTPTAKSVTSFVTAVHSEPATLPSGQIFEPILPEPSTLVSFAFVVLLSSLVVWVWANQVVPVSRTNLALSKKNGPVKEYLDELRVAQTQSETQMKSGSESDMARAGAGAVETETVVASSCHVVSTNTTNNNLESPDDTEKRNNSRALERWLFTDWLQTDAARRTAGRQKEPALPVLTNAKWNSGDNPVLAASALIMGGVFLTAVAERLGSFLQD